MGYSIEGGIRCSDGQPRHTFQKDSDDAEGPHGFSITLHALELLGEDWFWLGEYREGCEESCKRLGSDMLAGLHFPDVVNFPELFMKTSVAAGGDIAIAWATDKLADPPYTTTAYFVYADSVDRLRDEVRELAVSAHKRPPGCNPLYSFVAAIETPPSPASRMD